jgi:hypothetical protein
VVDRLRIDREEERPEELLVSLKCHRAGDYRQGSSGGNGRLSTGVAEKCDP